VSFSCFHLLLFCRLSAAVLYVVLVRRVWFSILLRCSSNSYWKINFNQLQIQSMIWASMFQIHKHGHFGDFNFITLFVGILPFAINLDDLSLFAYSSFLFLAMLNLYLHLMCSINYWNEWISLFLIKKKTLEPHIQREK
jgi:hypothetical protein